MGFNKRLMSTASAGFEVGFTTLTQGSNLTVGVNNATEKYMVWTSSSRVVMCDTAALANRYSLQAYTFNGSTFTTSGSSLIFITSGTAICIRKAISY